MDGTPGSIEGRFLDRFWKAWVTVADACDVLSRTLKFHYVDYFLDQIASLWADNVATEHSVIVLR